MQLLRQDVLKEVLDEAYETEAENQEFHEFLEQFSTGKDDRPVMEAVLAAYHFSMGQPWPLEWLQECREMYVSGGAALTKNEIVSEKTDDAKEHADRENQTEDVCGEKCDGTANGTEAIAEEQKSRSRELAEDESEQSGSDPLWLQAAVDDTKHVLEEAGNLVQRAYDTAMEPFGPAAYGLALLDDLEQIKRVRVHRLPRTCGCVSRHASLQAPFDQKGSRCAGGEKTAGQGSAGSSKDGTGRCAHALFL